MSESSDFSPVIDVEEQEIEAEEEVDDYEVTHEPNKGMTLFMLGKTYRWVTRAKVQSWFSQAFSMSARKEKRGSISLYLARPKDREQELGKGVAKVFYQLPQRKDPLSMEFEPIVDGPGGF